VTERALAPYSITLADGKEYNFYSSWACVKRLSEKMRKLQGAGGQPAPDALADLLPGLLYDCCTNRGDMTLEQFEDIIPGDAKWIEGHVAAIRAHSEMAVSRPPKASVESGPTTTGSESGPSAEPSESATQSSGG